MNNILEKIAIEIKSNHKFDLDKFGVFHEIKYNDWLHYTPYEKSLNLIRKYPNNNIVFFGGNYCIKEVENNFGQYRQAYNWRDNFTRFTFDQFVSQSIKEIYFEKNNEIIIDKQNNQYIEDDHRGNKNVYQYDGLSFDSFTLILRS